MDTTRMKRGTAEKIEMARKLRKQGLTVAQIAEQMDYSVQSVERWLHYENYQKLATARLARANYRQRQRRRGISIFARGNLRDRVRLYVDEMLGDDA